MLDESEQPAAVLEQGGGHVAHFFVVTVQVLLGERQPALLQRNRAEDQLVAIDQAALILAPETEQASIQGQRVTAKSLRVGGLGEVLNAENVALQMRPAQLRQPLVIFEIGAEAVAAPDAREPRPPQMV